jgi:hypothetical protein
MWSANPFWASAQELLWGNLSAEDQIRRTVLSAAEGSKLPLEKTAITGRAPGFTD